MGVGNLLFDVRMVWEGLVGSMGESGLEFVVFIWYAGDGGYFSVLLDVREGAVLIAALLRLGSKVFNRVWALSEDGWRIVVGLVSLKVSCAFKLY